MGKMYQKINFNEGPFKVFNTRRLLIFEAWLDDVKHNRNDLGFAVVDLYKNKTRVVDKF